MSLPTRWNPFAPLNPLNPLGRGDPFADVDALLRTLRPLSLGRDYERALDMRLDIREDDDSYIVDVEIPGLSHDSIDVTVDGNQVGIRTEIGRELSQGRGKEVYSERYRGQASRMFMLPTEVDADASTAKYDGGVLTLTLPKKPGAAIRHVPIH